MKIILLAISLNITFLHCASTQSDISDSYIISVDNLRMRDNPGLTSNVITHLKVGHVVTWNGVISEIRDEVELRGEIFNSPYYKVVTGDNKEGWVYGGAIYRICRGNLDMGEKSKIADLAQFLESLYPKGLDSGGKALNYFFENFDQSDPELVTAAVIVTIRFFENLEVEMWDILESIPWPEEDIEQYAKSDLPIFNRLRNSGFKIEAAEGMFYPKVDWTVINEELGGHALQSMKAFLQLQSLDSEVQVESDGAIIVPIGTLGDSAIRWENFNMKYKNFVMKERTEGIENRFKMLILTGMDNSPAFDWEDNAEEDFKKGWYYIIEKYPDSEFTTDLKEYIKLLKATDWKSNARVKKLSSKYFDTYY